MFVKWARIFIRPSAGRSREAEHARLTGQVMDVQVFAGG